MNDGEIAPQTRIDLALALLNPPPPHGMAPAGVLDLVHRVLSDRAGVRAVANMNLPTVGDTVYCPFCDWRPEHGAHENGCVILLATNALGQRPPWHDIDGRRCHAS